MAFVPATSAETRQWLLRFHSVNDSLDPRELPTIYAQNASMRFGNAPVIQGIEALQSHFTSSWQGLDSMHHEIAEFDLIGNDKIYQSCHITWKVKNDPTKEMIVVPAMAVIHLVTSGAEKGLISSAEFYMDPAPLIAAFARVR